MKNLISLLVILFFFQTCSKVPITGRRQIKLLPNATLNSMSLTSYKTFLSQNQLSSNVQQSEMVKRVGKNIADATTRFFKATGRSKELSGYKWEFNLIQDPSANAWCMPGGKVVVYTGLLPITQDEDGLAVVMGHEIAHAIANHGNERMSQGIATELGGVALTVAVANKPQETQAVLMNAYGAGSTLGVLLPFSRLHESEADEIGICLAAMAGYNPEKAIAFWERMDEMSGATPPTFLSTHPSHQTRIEDIKKALPRARAYAQKYK